MQIFEFLGDLSLSFWVKVFLYLFLIYLSMPWIKAIFRGIKGGIMQVAGVILARKYKIENYADYTKNLQLIDTELQQSKQDLENIGAKRDAGHEKMQQAQMAFYQAQTSEVQAYRKLKQAEYDFLVVQSIYKSYKANIDEQVKKDYEMAESNFKNIELEYNKASNYTLECAKQRDKAEKELETLVDEEKSAQLDYSAVITKKRVYQGMFNKKFNSLKIS